MSGARGRRWFEWRLRGAHGRSGLCSARGCMPGCLSGACRRKRLRDARRWCRLKCKLRAARAWCLCTRWNGRSDILMHRLRRHIHLDCDSWLGSWRGRLPGHRPRRREHAWSRHRTGHRRWRLARRSRWGPLRRDDGRSPLVRRLPRRVASCLRDLAAGDVAIVTIAAPLRGARISADGTGDETDRILRPRHEQLPHTCTDRSLHQPDRRICVPRDSRTSTHVATIRIERGRETNEHLGRSAT